MFKILLQAHKSNNEVIHKKVRAGKLLKLLLLIFYVIMYDSPVLLFCKPSASWRA